MQMNPSSKRVYSLDISNESASTTWGGAYMSNVITVPIAETISTSSQIFVSYVNSTPPTALPLINNVSTNSVSIRLIRFTEATLTGTVNVMVI